MKVVKGLIYKAKRGCVYDTNTPKGKKYNCYQPCMTGNFYIVDCWVCDSAGNVHPGYNVSGVPVETSSLGKIIAEGPDVRFYV